MARACVVKTEKELKMIEYRRNRIKNINPRIEVEVDFSLENGEARSQDWVPHRTGNCYIFVDANSGLVAINTSDRCEGPEVFNDESYSVVGIWDSENQETF